MKRLLLSLVLTVSTMFSTVWAYDFSVVVSSGQTLYFNRYSNTVEVTYPGSSSLNPYNGYTKPTGNLVIPTTVTCNGTTYSVTSIGSSAFENCSGLTSVNIPNSVTSIGSSAFDDCSSLTTLNFNAINCSDFSYYYHQFDDCPISTINIGDSVQRIPAYFAYYKSSLSAITIPNSVTYIGSSAFANCSSLTSVTIGNSVTYIGISAFSNCNNLRTLNFNAINCSDFSSTSSYHQFYGCPISTINIGDSVQHIPANFVYNKTSLTNLTIGNSITIIESSTFRGCSSLTTLNFNAINCSDFSSSNHPFIFCPISTITIGDSVQRIPAYFAYSKSSLSAITIPNSVTSIGNYAFYSCSGLTTLNFNAINCNDFTAVYSSGLPFYGCPISTITIGDSVQRIPAYFAYYKSSLSAITIPNSVTYIGSSAFDGCSSLISASIGNSVTSIGSSAFQNCSSLTSITIPNSVTSIESSAFEDCSSLTSVNIPNSVTSIGEYSFYGCSSLTSVTIPNSIDTIRNYTFYDCSSLDSILIPNSVTYIGSSAFANCSSLTSVTIPNSVTSIGSSAFANCSSLTSVTIPNSVTSIGSSAFEDCSSLTTLNFNAINCSGFSSGSNHPFYATPISIINIGDSVQHIPANFVYNKTSLTNLTIGNSITIIESSTFRDCSSLTSVTIPNSVTSIGEWAFEGCSSLTSVTIPNSIDTIRNYTFYDCSSLDSILIPNSVTSIGSSAFANCSSLTSVTIGNSVTYIGISAFSNCNNLRTLNFNAINCNYSNYIYHSDLPFYNSPITTINIGDSVQRIPAYFAYNLDSLNSITIPNSVTSIGEWAFRGCSGLTSITIPNTIDTIRNYTFYNCSGLTSVTIPNSVTSIGEAAFGGCSGLTSVTIPNSVTSIGGGAFSGCSSLTSASIGNSVTSIGNSAFADCSSLDSILIPNSVTSIGRYAFSGCSSLTSASIGNSVTSIGNSAFEDCSSLTKLNFNAINCSGFNSSYYHPFYGTPISIINIGDSVQYVPAYLAFNFVNLVGLHIGNGVTTIGEYAFDNCNLHSITIPNSVTTIGEHAFTNCNYVTSITIGNSVTTIGDWAFSISRIYHNLILNFNAINCSDFSSSTVFHDITTVNIGDSVQHIPAYFACHQTDLSEIIIPNNVTSIGNSAFKNCSSITSVSIGNSVTTIGNSAFKNCTSLTTLNFNAINCSDFYYYEDNDPFSACPISRINIGDSVQHIPAYFASGFDNLTELWIGNNVTTIGDRAFYNCYNLIIYGLTIPNSVTTIGDGAFKNCTLRGFIHIGNSVTTIGDGAFEGCYDVNYITIGNSVTTIGDRAFYGCNSYRGHVTSLAMNPPTLSHNSFSNSMNELHIPCGSLSNYRNSTWDTIFSTIIEDGCDNITITVSSANENMGTVSGGGTYEAGSQITITATAVEGYHFTSWNDGNTDNPRTITVTEDATYIANFAPDNPNETYTITVMSANNSMGSVSGGGTYAVGSQITITATAVEGYHFTSWNDGNTDNPRTITVTEDATYIATFEEGVGIESIDILDNLTFYPNPTKGILNFSMDVEKIEVMDMMGKMVMQFCNVNEINIASLPKGVYCLKLSYNGKITVHKIIKE